MPNYAKFQRAEWERSEYRMCGMPMESPQHDVYGGGVMGVHLLGSFFLKIFENVFLNVKFYSNLGIDTATISCMPP